MSDVLTAVFLGLSFGNLWLCALLVFSLQTTNRLTCGGYLVGRALTIMALSVMVALAGKVVQIDHSILNLLSGIFLLLFAGYLAATRIYEWVPPWKRASSRNQDQHQGCDGECSTCPTHSDPQYADICADCSDNEKLCAAEEPELEPLTRKARQERGRTVSDKQSDGFFAGMILGSLRGAALCSKLVVLIPVLLGASIAKAVGLGLVFSLSSSIYPLLGFALGAFALQLVRYKRVLFGVSCIMLSCFGGFYVIKGIGWLSG